jgi:hypothetical protein
MTERLFKCLDENQNSCYHDKQHWVPGEWVEVEGELIPHLHGLHASREQDLLDYVSSQIWSFEYEGQRIDQHRAIVVRKGQIVNQYTNWTDTSARLLACRIARDVLPIWKRTHNNGRLQELINVAESYAQGKVTRDKVEAARVAFDSSFDISTCGDILSSAMWNAARYTSEDDIRNAVQDVSWHTVSAVEWPCGMGDTRYKYTQWLLEILDGKGTWWK